MPTDAKAADGLPSGLKLTAISPAFREDPHPLLDALRVAEPVHRDRQFDRVYLSRYDDIRAVLNDRTLSADPRRSRPGSMSRLVLMGQEGEFVPSMLFMDEPDHKRLRGLVSQAFNQRSVDAFRPRIRAIAEALLDQAGDGPFDLIEAFAAPLPTIVIAEMLGVDPGDQGDFKRWSDALVNGLNPMRTNAQTAALREAQEHLNAYFAKEIAARRASPRGDLLGALVGAEEAGERLGEQDISVTARLLLVAGNVTTTDLIGNGVLALLRHADQAARLRAEPAMMARAVEEMLRYDPPVAQASRIATAPREIGGVAVADGQTLTVSLLAAGHDPAVHDAPHAFDIGREDSRHLAFGGGAHFCLGAPLARAEAQIGIGLLLERFATLRLDPARPPERRALPTFNGLKSLWVRTD